MLLCHRPRPFVRVNLHFSSLFARNIIPGIHVRVQNRAFLPYSIPQLMTAMPQHYNAIILGSGQAGTPLASHLRSLNQSVCLVEREHIAGCCVNEGCTPTKTMVASGRIAYLAGRASDYGVSLSSGGQDGVGEGDVVIDMHKIRQRKRDIVTSFRGGSERRLKMAGVDIVMGEARFIDGLKIAVTEQGGRQERELTADAVYINTGCRPSRPQIPGLEQIDPTRILDSTSIQELAEIPAHLVVIGGGYIGLEFAQLFSRLGAKVTIIHRSPRLLSKLDDPSIVDCITNILRDDNIEVLVDVKDTHVKPTLANSLGSLPISISLCTREKERASLHASHILLATGRIPNTDTLGLEKAGVKTSASGHVIVNSTLETNVPGIYAMGDVKGGPAFTHVSYDDFRIIKDSTTEIGKTEGVVKTTDQRAPYIPSVVYIDPQFAHVGPKWGALPTLIYGKKVVTYSMPGSWIARGLETEETRGMLKAVVVRHASLCLCPPLNSSCPSLTAKLSRTANDTTFRMLTPIKSYHLVLFRWREEN